MGRRFDHPPPTKHLQIATLLDITEHLRATEGLNEAGPRKPVSKRLEQAVSTIPFLSEKRCGDPGTGFGDRTPLNGTGGGSGRG